ncbi:hypothetical protein GCM10022222_17510 [Amycolatopsis ultiminotia]|uniref:Uncharacterized protein n=1 Tax=Amycolatopsis ultiminotia TaxID=543629 RepID=A0ABP6VEU3_9PSEU
MVSLGDVKRWNPGALNKTATTMQQREQVLVHSGDDFLKIIPVEGWSGPAADNAASAQDDLRFRIDKMAAGAAVVHKALMQACLPASRRRPRAGDAHRRGHRQRPHVDVPTRQPRRIWHR